MTLFAVAIYPAKLPANMTARKFPGAYTNDTTLTIRISPLPSKGRVLYKGCAGAAAAAACRRRASASAAKRERPAPRSRRRPQALASGVAPVPHEAG